MNTKRFKTILLLSLAIAAVLAVVPALLPSGSSRGVTAEQLERLEPGMTRAEAERVLFGPPRNDLGYPAIIWLPQADGGRISAEIAPASPAVEFFSHEDRPKNGRRAARNASALDFFPRESAKDGHQAAWVTRTGLIAVEFGLDGRLRQKYLSTVHEQVPPSVIDWLATRPKMIRRSLGFY